MDLIKLIFCKMHITVLSKDNVNDEADNMYSIEPGNFKKQTNLRKLNKRLTGRRPLVLVGKLHPIL